MKLWPHFIILLGLSFSLEAQALSTFDTATRFYQAHQYAKAGALYQSFLQENPKNYQGHYQLANCYCALGNWEKANYHYGMLLVIPSPPQMQARAREAITMVVRKQMNLPQLPSSTSQAVASAEKEEVVNPKTSQEEATIASLRKKAQDIYDEQSRRYEADKQAILADAEKRSSLILDAAQKQMDYLEKNHNYWARNARTGEILVAIPDVVRRSIMEPAETEAKRIMQEAEYRTARLRNESRIQESVDGFQKQALAGGDGIKLDLNNSNLHLRNYTSPKLARQKNTDNASADKRQVATGKTNLQ